MVAVLYSQIKIAVISLLMLMGFHTALPPVVPSRQIPKVEVPASLKIIHKLAGATSTSTSPTLDTSVRLFGKDVKLDYTNENAGEDLIIKMTQQNFSINLPKPIASRPMPDLIPKSIMDFSITNISGLDQFVTIVLTSNGKISVTRLRSTNQIVSQDVVVRKTSIGLSSIIKKTVIGNSFATGDPVLIPAGGTEYFEADLTLNFSKVGDSEDFYLEAFGNLGGYGHSF